MDNEKINWAERLEKVREEQYMSNFVDPEHKINTVPDTRLEEFEQQYGLKQYQPIDILKGVCINYDNDGEQE